MTESGERGSLREEKRGREGGRGEKKERLHVAI